MATTVNKWSAIPCQEMHNTRREWFDADGRFRASVKLQCAWEDRFKLICDLYTSSYGHMLPTSTVGYHPRVYPHVGSTSTNSVGGDPGFPAPLMSRIGVDSAQVSSIAEAYTTDAYEETVVSKTTAEVDVQYGRHYNIQETIEWDVQAVTQSYQQFNWKTDPVAANDLNILGELEAPVSVYNTAILTREFIGLGIPVLVNGQIVRPLVPDIRTLVDCVNFTNSVAYTSEQLGRTFKEGTLLMLEPEIRPSVDMQNVFNPTPALSPNKFGAQGFSVKVRFLYKPGAPKVGNGVDTSIDTHNLFWRAKMVNGMGGRGGWDQLVVLDPLVTAGNFAPFTPFARLNEVSTHWLQPASVPNPVQIP